MTIFYVSIKYVTVLVIGEIQIIIIIIMFYVSFMFVIKTYVLIKYKFK